MTMAVSCPPLGGGQHPRALHRLKCEGYCGVLPGFHLTGKQASGTTQSPDSHPHRASSSSTRAAFRLSWSEARQQISVASGRGATDELGCPIESIDVCGAQKPPTPSVTREPPVRVRSESISDPWQGKGMSAPVACSTQASCFRTQLVDALQHCALNTSLTNGLHISV
jgi:hypothetical protein